MINKCDSCKNNFATCKSDPVFGIDLNPELRGKDADVVLECDAYIPEKLEEKK